MTCLLLFGYRRSTVALSVALLQTGARCAKLRSQPARVASLSNPSFLPSDWQTEGSQSEGSAFLPLAGQLPPVAAYRRQVASPFLPTGRSAFLLSEGQDWCPCLAKQPEGLGLGLGPLAGAQRAPVLASPGRAAEQQQGGLATCLPAFGRQVCQQGVAFRREPDKE